MPFRTIALNSALALALLSSSTGFAVEEHNAHIWSIFRYEGQAQGYGYSAQLQHRYRFDKEKLFEEQVNLAASKETSHGVWTTIATVGTVDGYQRLNELRIAGQWERDFEIAKAWVYSLRFRQEFRQFSDVDEVAPRFRIGNEVERLLSGGRSLSLNQEINIYQTDYIDEASGFASLRTILSYEFPFKNEVASASYLNDYREDKVPTEMRHVLLLTFVIE